MKKSNVKANYILNLIYQIFTLIIPLITAPYVSRVLTSDGIGQVSFSLSIVSYFTIFAMFGFSYYGQKAIAQHQDSKQERSKIFWEVFILKSITSLISLIVYILLIKSNILVSYNRILLIQTLNIISIALDATFLLQGEEDFKKIVIPNIIIRLLGIVSIFAFVKNSKDLNFYVIIQSVTLILSSLITLLLSPRFLCRVKLNELNIKKHFIPAFKLFIPTIAISIYALLDKTLIGLITKNNSEVGFYEQAEKISKMVLTIVTSLGAVMIPKNAKLFAENNYKEVNKNIETAFSFSMLIAMPLMLGLIAIASNFVPWFFGAGYDKSIILIQILSVLIFSIGLNNVLGIQYLIPTNKDNIFTISVIIGAITNLILNIITIRYWGAVGAAISTIVAETVILIYQMIYLRKTFNFIKMFKDSIKCIISAILMFGVIYPLSLLLHSSIINTCILVAIGGLIYLIMLLILREKTLLNIIKIISKNKVVVKMKKIIKRIIKKSNIFYKLLEIRRQKVNGCLKGNIITNILKFKVLDFSNYSNYNKVKYKKVDSKYFYYYIDTQFAIKKTGKLLDNLALDYSLFLDNSVQDLLIKYPNNKFIKLLSNQINRVTSFLKDKQLKIFNDFNNNKCTSFESAVQRILFINQICWQTGHRLIGLGRLDKFLHTYYINDLNNNIITKELAEDMLREFFLLLNKDYKFKSSSVLGDTGQIIILGGLNEDGSYLQSPLTEMILTTLTSLNLPDPKTLLRVSSKMPKELLSTAIECISKGTGSPLLSNDDVIIKNMLEFGYETQDAYDYCTSACWEIVPLSNAVEINNYSNLNFVKILNETLNNREFDNFDNLLEEFGKNILSKIDDIINIYNTSQYHQDPFMAFFKNKNKNENILRAKYENLGILTVGISNTVNALINIKEYVFIKHEYTIKQMFEKMNDEKFINDLKTKNLKFGNDDQEVIDLTNKIMKYASDYLLKYNKKNVIKVKIGYSSPLYLAAGKTTSKSLDGRKDNEPFNVHISASTPLAYTELISFASRLDYSQPCINGNVIDFSTTPQLINEQREKFVLLIETAIEMGFYQMQINVVNYEQLVQAKNNPELFPNLIVRVWGFSAYFNDLSTEYKDLLIERAKMYESVN